MTTLRNPLLALTLLSAACGTAAPTDAIGPDDFSHLDEKADSFSSRMKVLGPVLYGTSPGAVPYKSTPRYRAYTFKGNPNDYVSVWIRSIQGDPMGWILDGKFNTLATNDNAWPDVLDSHLVTNLPAKAKANATYYIVFRERNLQVGTFSVELTGGTDYYRCSADTDCLSVPRVGCCDNGWREAVAATQIQAYSSSFTCSTAHPVCPLFVVKDSRQPECNVGTGHCEMVPVDRISCGGNIRNAHHCPDGFFCHFDGVPDVGGDCLTQCNHNYTCPSGEVWDDAQCKCLPSAKDPCNGTCATGQQCSYCWGNWTCLAPGVRC